MTALKEVVTLYPLLAIETLVVAIIVAVALGSQGGDPGWFRGLNRSLARISRRPTLSIAIAGFAPLVFRVLLLPILPVPIPGTTDEFSYLLAADTFVSGRLTNPTHPMWAHFETMHVVHQPTYASMYPIGQPLMLAAGTLVSGVPWVGVWLSVGLMCAALCWMLQGWLPARWAVLGSLIAAIRLGTFSHVMNSYWGGAVAAFGGLLILGALPRIMRWQRVRDSLLLGVGIAVVANTRPAEGLFMAAGVALVLVKWIWHRRSANLPEILRNAVLPVLAVTVLAGGATAYYFFRVTGSPWLMPYQLNRLTYAQSPMFLWEPPQQRPAPSYRHKVMRDFYQWDLDVYLKTRSVRGLAVRLGGKVWTFCLFYIGPVLTLPLLIMGHRVLRDRRIRPLLIVGGVSILGLIGPMWFSAPYAAPMTGIVYAVLLQAMRHLQCWRWRAKHIGPFLTRCIPVICVFMLAVRIAADPLHLNLTTGWRSTWFYAQPGYVDRAEIDMHLKREPGGHLVLVRYSPQHDIQSEWVYNAADIDRAKVVWAREMDQENNEKLITYFAGRHVWLVQPDASPAKLESYPAR